MNIISFIVGLIALGTFIAGMAVNSAWLGAVAIASLIIHLAIDHHIETREHWRRYFDGEK